MSGHSKWSQIKHRKAAADAKKSALFGKLARAISVAARGNPDLQTNLRLQAEVQRARAVNMPSDSIERAIRRVADKDAATFHEVQVEFIGPGGVAVVVSAITDNSNRTIMELRRIATDHGARTADAGSAIWMFKSRGIVRVATAGRDLDALELAAIDAGADDVQPKEDSLLVLCPPDSLPALVSALGEAVQASTTVLVPNTVVQVTGDTEDSILSFVDALEDHDDVQRVFTNMAPYGDLSWD